MQSAESSSDKSVTSNKVQKRLHRRDNLLRVFPKTVMMMKRWEGARGISDGEKARRWTRVGRGV